MRRRPQISEGMTGATCKSPPVSSFAKRHILRRALRIEHVLDRDMPEGHLPNSDFSLISFSANSLLMRT